MHVRVFCLLLVAALAGALYGCAEVRFVSDYDPYTDQAVTELQRDVETLLNTLERHPLPPDCRYERHADAYAAMDVELNLLLARNSVRPDNTLTQTQLELLSDSLDALESLHRDSRDDGCLTAADIAPLRIAFNASFTAILKLELAKRRPPANQE